MAILTEMKAGQEEMKNIDMTTGLQQMEANQGHLKTNMTTGLQITEEKIIRSKEKMEEEIAAI